MPRRRPPSIRTAFILLLVICVCLVVVLLACPPSSPRAASSRPAMQSSPAVQTPPEEKPSIPEPPNERTAAGVPAGRGERSSHAQPPAARPWHPEPEGRLAVIIDDAGYSLKDLQPFLELPGPLTVAVLPNLPDSREAARRVVAAGKDLILHCPMEPLNGENPGPGALAVGQSQSQVDSLLSTAFDSVPGAIGMNNHMGSRATSDLALMTIVMGFLKARGGFFLDSRTTAETVAEQAAAGAQVPFLRRDFFLDANSSEKQIAAAFAASVTQARGRGSAVIIGHVQNPGVLDILRKESPGLADHGVRLARIAEILERQRKESAE